MKVLKCKICGYEWFPRTEKPVCCPSCKSRNWKKGIKKNEEQKT